MFQFLLRMRCYFSRFHMIREQEYSGLAQLVVCTYLKRKVPSSLTVNVRRKKLRTVTVRACHNATIVTTYFGIQVSSYAAQCITTSFYYLLCNFTLGFSIFYVETNTALSRALAHHRKIHYASQSSLFSIVALLYLLFSIVVCFTLSLHVESCEVLENVSDSHYDAFKSYKRFIGIF